MMKQPENFDLDAAFDAARATPPQMSAALVAQIAADAQAHLPAAPLWRRALAALGGAAGVGGLVTATVAGFWLGIAPPADTVDPLVWFGEDIVTAEDDFTDLIGLEWYSEEG